ncbi:hypothetical protein BH09DEP1_BH09DEP1_5180 [soil metagenome]
MNIQYNSDFIIGTILVVWGASILLKVFFGIDIPIFKPLVAIFLIYLGVQMLFGPKQNIFYRNSTFTYKNIDDQD